MFDFTDEKKQKYYTRAEQFLKENDLECFGIDRSKFGVMGNRYTRIALHPFTKKTVSREELARAKTFAYVVVVNDRYTRKNSMEAAPLREKAYLKLPLDEEDM